MAVVCNVSSAVLKILGIILLVAGVLKAYQLLTEPVAGNSIWTYRPFLILQVEFELALGIWLLSGLLPKAAWLASLICFSFFSMVTLYKGLTGAESCGCFGSVHVSPWITLLAIDLPGVIALSLLRPASPFASLGSFLRRQKPVHGLILEFLTPPPSPTRLAITAGLALAVMGTSTPILALNEPATITSTYEILEPETWVGKQLPILEHIDVADQLRQGPWVVLFYHYDCPDCQRAIREYQQMARDPAGNEDSLRVAFIAVPPYGYIGLLSHEDCVWGRMDASKQWLLTTPVVCVLTDSVVAKSWQGEAPPFKALLNHSLPTRLVPDGVYGDTGGS